MDIQKEKDAYLGELLERDAITQDEYNDIIFRPSVNAFDSNYLSARFIDNINWGWNSWQAAKSQEVPEGFAIVSQKDLLELTIAINAVDLATHTESKTNEVREMWQQVALKLMALGATQEPANE